MMCLINFPAKTCCEVASCSNTFDNSSMAGSLRLISWRNLFEKAVLMDRLAVYAMALAQVQQQGLYEVEVM